MKHFACMLAVCIAIWAKTADSQTFTTLVQFTGTSGTASGEYPYGSLTVSGGTIYGMTQNGGATGDGNIFSVGTNGANFQNLLSFTGSGGTASGEAPTGGLILSGTTIYGMTNQGGADGYGNIFSVGIDGSGYDDLYDFTGGTDGGNPYGDLTFSGGALFGMTSQGGANGDGTVFALTLPTPTPEPGTLALVAAAAVAYSAYRWRRMRRAKNR